MWRKNTDCEERRGHFSCAFRQLVCPRSEIAYAISQR
nr:MAG TPA: hypothetical protein [Caudoviricetes sp.]